MSENIALWVFLAGVVLLVISLAFRVKHMHKGVMELSEYFGKQTGSLEDSVKNIGADSAKSIKRIDDLEFQQRAFETKTDIAMANVEEDIKVISRSARREQ